MWYVTLLFFAFGLYLPPFDLASRLADRVGAEGPSVITLLFPEYKGLEFAAIVLGGYLATAIIFGTLARYLWPTEKPYSLRMVCAPDRAGGLDLALVLCGATIFLGSFVLSRLSLFQISGVHVPADIPVLGLLLLTGALGHSAEMNAWLYAAQEARRRAGLRGQ